MSHDITFTIPGQAQAASPAAVGLGGQVTGSVRVGARRGAGDSVRLTARPGEDVVVLSIANGPTLVLHPEAARDLMRAQGQATRRGAAVPSDDDDSVTVPAQLGWAGLDEDGGDTRGVTRGWIGQVVLNAIDIVKGLVIDRAADIVSTLAVKKLDGQVDPGVYALSAQELKPLKGSGRMVGAGSYPTAFVGMSAVSLLSLLLLLPLARERSRPGRQTGARRLGEG